MISGCGLINGIACWITLSVAAVSVAKCWGRSIISAPAAFDIAAICSSSVDTIILLIKYLL